MHTAKWKKGWVGKLRSNWVCTPPPIGGKRTSVDLATLVAVRSTGTLSFLWCYFGKK